jgi:KDO2-lipid IV(A) lauroyltransferase
MTPVTEMPETGTDQQTGDPFDERDKRPPGPDQQLKPRHFFHLFMVALLHGLVFIMPNVMCRAIGRVIGDLFHTFDKRHRDIALRNFDQAFGDNKSEDEKRAMTRVCFQHFGVAIMETLRLTRLNRNNYLRYVSFEGVERFQEGLAHGKGMILCSAHYGNWEVMNLALGYQGLPMSVMARPIDNPFVHRYLEKIRTRSGNRVLYKHKSIRRVFTTLKENRIVGIVNDQDVHDHNRIMVPFFGRPTSTTPIPAALAYKTGAPIITGYAEPLGKGRYLLKYGELIYPDTKAAKDAEIERLTLLLNQRLEEQIRHAPAYWMWMHKRFKTGEHGITDFYKGPRNG